MRKLFFGFFSCVFLAVAISFVIVAIVTWVSPPKIDLVNNYFYEENNQEIHFSVNWSKQKYKIRKLNYTNDLGTELISYDKYDKETGSYLENSIIPWNKDFLEKWTYQEHNLNIKLGGFSDKKFYADYDCNDMLKDNTGTIEQNEIIYPGHYLTTIVVQWDPKIVIINDKTIEPS